MSVPQEIADLQARAMLDSLDTPEAMYPTPENPQVSSKTRSRRQRKTRSPNTPKITGGFDASVNLDSLTEDQILALAETMEPAEFEAMLDAHYAGLEDAPVEAPKKTRGGARVPKLQTSIQDFYFSIGTLASLFNQTDGAIILLQAEKLAEAQYRYARKHPAYQDFLERFLDKSDLAVLVGAHFSIATAIAANHGIRLDRVGENVVRRFAKSGNKSTVPFRP